MESDEAGQDETISRDTLFAGRLHCLQHRSGYRFSVDAILAAHFSPPPLGGTVLDLCGGCGIISLICLYRWQEQIASVSCLELQPGLAALAARNRDMNGYAGKMEVVQGNLRSILDFFPAESFAQVICNPPFYKRNSGRPCQDQESFIARHQVHCTLAEVVGAAATVVRNRGKVTFVYPATGLNTLLVTLQQQHLVPKRLQTLYSYPDATAPARLVLVEAVKNGGDGMQVLPPFYIYERRLGAYSKTMQRLYDPD
ncbi:MAG: methyltransferase [Proteobacteria bacterium]|nr:methyltransferase [Pseudomonadota bacterium]MBU1649397.1 methyltransferase [Pseudomonadota bacterium]MBU1985908.1 methyltransferase [Pseudomonadota bacterium]